MMTLKEFTRSVGLSIRSIRRMAREGDVIITTDTRGCEVVDETNETNKAVMDLTPEQRKVAYDIA
jgi:Sec-independent protein translocase protein TatA